MNLHITKTAVNSLTSQRPAFFYNSAREGMQDLLENALSSNSEGVLLPAFIGWSAREGSGVFDPIKAVGANYDFYDLNDDLSVDVADVERLLATGRHRVLVIVQYFGRTEPRLPLLRELADRYEVLLVEDLAHGFFSAQTGGPAGKYGDVCLYSLHKMFPVRDGGQITYTRGDLVSGQNSTRPELAHTIMSYDWAEIAAARRRNFIALTERLAASPLHGSQFELLWPELDSSDVPQTLPVRICGSRRDLVYSGMNEAGFGMVSLYHTLIPEVRGRFARLEDLALHIINFPVHQDVDPSALDSMVESFHTHLEPS